MTTLFRRRAELNVQGKLIEDLSFEFRVEGSLSRTKNSAEIRIYNLAPDTRKFLQSRPGGVVVELHAGYQDQRQLPRILLGQIRIVTTLRSGADWITEITTGDADQASAQPISFSLGPGSTFENAVKRVVADLKAGAGNVASALRGNTKQYPNGITMHGFGDAELERLLSPNGLEHSWQNGEIQILPKGGAVNATAVLISEETGMVGSPEIGLKKAAPVAKVRTLLNAQIYPGRMVKIAAANLDGFFVAQKVVHHGETAGAEWYTDIECTPLRTATNAVARKPVLDTPLFLTEENGYGALVPGNIDLHRRPYVRNPDGSISTIYSVSIQRGSRVYLIPTVSDEGRILSPGVAEKYFIDKNRHLGIYRNDEEADAAGEAIHLDQLKNPPSNTLNNGLGPSDLQ